MTDNRTKLICPIVAATVEGMVQQVSAARAGGADIVEIRLDYLGRSPSAGELQALIAKAGLEVIVTNRPIRQGGKWAGDETARLELLARAVSAGADFADVEDDVPVSAWPACPVIVSHHDFDRVPGDLDAILAAMRRTPAAVLKVAFAASNPADALVALDLAYHCDRPAIALAMGEAGLPSRLLAGKAGAFGTFAALDAGQQSAPGQPTLAEIRGLYRWADVWAGSAVCGVIGCPVGHSLSPAVHNAACAALGIDAVYVPLRVEPAFEEFARFMDALAKLSWLNWRGLSVTIPHKENALAYLGAERCDALTRRLKAVNTIIIDGGELTGTNTDHDAAIDCLCGAMGVKRYALGGKRAAVLGAGGAARAIVAALAASGAKVTVHNRTVQRARERAEEFLSAWGDLESAADGEAEIVVNCTPIGMHPHVDASPLGRLPASARVVFDTIYTPLRTRLLEMAERQGAVAVSGLEMFIAQAAGQFGWWWLYNAPSDVMRRAALDALRRRETPTPTLRLHRKKSQP